MLRALTPLLLSCVVLAATVASAQTRALSEAQWREDIAAAVAAIRDNHPRPFRALTEQEFAARLAQLDQDLPTLSDKGAALRLAALVSLIEDGHTRLSLPRAVPALEFNPSHGSPNAAAHEALTFATLPFRLRVLDDGLFIVAAAREYRQHIGAEVVAFGETNAAAAVVATRGLLHAENDYSARLLAADRLALPAVLEHLQLIEDPSRVALTLARDGKTQTITIKPLGPGAEVEIVGPTFPSAPLARRHRDQSKWHAQVPGESAWYIKVDEIEQFPTVLLADFIADALAQARQAGARRLLLDLRDNHGGTSSFNPAIVNALGRSEFNQWGRLYVLVGRETLSAASRLMSALEQYTAVIFVGEPSGAQPSSFGDPRRIQLPNSGLTLRSSTLAWPSWLAGEFREYIETHLDAPVTSVDYFAGRDVAIEAALGYSPPASPVAQMAELFEKDKLQAGLLRFLGWLNAPVDGTHDAVGELLTYGHRYLDASELKKGRFMMVLARDFYPTSVNARTGLGRAMELNGDPESARERYQEALALDPDNVAAKGALKRLGER